MKTERILLLRPDRAGDAIKTLPVVRALQDRHRQFELHLLASEHNASLFESEKGVQVHILPKGWHRLKLSTLKQQYEKLPLGNIDAAINLMCDPMDGWDLLMNAVKANKKFSVDRAGKLPGISRLELPDATPANRDESENIALLISQALGINLSGIHNDYPAAPRLLEQDQNEAEERMGLKHGKWLGICPAASVKHRIHPLKKWRPFIAKVTQLSQFDRFFLFGTPSDYPYLEQLRLASPERDRIEFCFPSSFRALGAYLQRLDGVVAVESGPLHLARSLEVKSLGILSGGDVNRWFHELGQGEKILRRGLLSRFPSSIEMVWAFQRWIGGWETINTAR